MRSLFGTRRIAQLEQKIREAGILDRHCKTCEHWTLQKMGYLYGEGWRACGLTRAADDGYPKYLGNARVSAAFVAALGGELWTRATFGCVQHEEKP